MSLSTCCGLFLCRWTEACHISPLIKKVRCFFQSIYFTWLHILFTQAHVNAYLQQKNKTLSLWHCLISLFNTSTINTCKMCACVAVFHIPLCKARQRQGKFIYKAQFVHKANQSALQLYKIRRRQIKSCKEIEWKEKLIGAQNRNWAQSYTLTHRPSSACKAVYTEHPTFLLKTEGGRRSAMSESGGGWTHTVSQHETHPKRAQGVQRSHVQQNSQTSTKFRTTQCRGTLYSKGLFSLMSLFRGCWNTWASVGWTETCCMYCSTVIAWNSRLITSALPPRPANGVQNIWEHSE